MKKVTLMLSLAFAMSILIGSMSFAADEPDTSTKFFGNLRLLYVNMKDTDEQEFEDSFGIHYLEIMIKKQVDCMGIYVNERIGGANNRTYLYEGWISANLPCMSGLVDGWMLKGGLVPVPFGIFIHGLYYPKGEPFNRNFMWEYDWGARLDGKKKISDDLKFDVAVAYLLKEDSGGELGAFSGGGACPACVGERDTVSARIGADINAGDALGLKAGGSVQYGKLIREGQEDKDTRFGVAGDVVASIKALPIPVAIQGEFINYSMGDMDELKGNILMGQLDVTALQNMGPITKAIVSLHYSTDMPTEGNSKTSLIGQLRLIMCKQLNIFAQVFGQQVEGTDDLLGQGLRVWFMYIF